MEEAFDNGCRCLKLKAVKESIKDSGDPSALEADQTIKEHTKNDSKKLNDLGSKSKKKKKNDTNNPT